MTNGFDAPAIGRVSCMALVDQDAAYVVLGQDGDCSRDDPCGTIDTMSSVLRFYLGVDDGETEVVDVGLGTHVEVAVRHAASGLGLHEGVELGRPVVGPDGVTHPLQRARSATE